MIFCLVFFFVLKMITLNFLSRLSLNFLVNTAGVGVLVDHRDLSLFLCFMFKRLLLVSLNVKVETCRSQYC